jgi:hypothetical protein
MSTSIYDILLNSAKKLYSSLNTGECISLLEHLITLDPHNREAHIQLAYAYCRTDDYVKGRDELVWVWMPVFGNQIGILDPSKKLAGLRILISSDAGLGDCIMFSRFLKLLDGRNCHITLQVPDPLIRLMCHSNIANSVISSNDSLPSHDIRVPMHNLMSALITEPQDPVVSNSNYLFTDASDRDYFKSCLSRSGRRKVGLCWRGNPSLPEDNKRSVSLELIQSLTCEDDELISLVPGTALDIGRTMHWFEFKDIAETAALIVNLDYVITVDTMIAHLSGALGIPTLVLNRFNGCWRWSESGHKNRWYDSIDILRQESNFHWPINRSNYE